MSVTVMGNFYYFFYLLLFFTILLSSILLLLSTLSLVFFTVFFPLFWTRELIFPFCTQPHRFWSWLLRWSLGWREIIIISHGRKRKCVWEREWALGHLLKYSPATALLLAVGRTRLVMPALLPAEGQRSRKMAHLWSPPPFSSVSGLGMENRHGARG